MFLMSTPPRPLCTAGADLQNLLNEAAILAARRNLKELSKDEIADALERIIAGPEKKVRKCARVQGVWAPCMPRTALVCLQPLGHARDCGVRG